MQPLQQLYVVMKDSVTIDSDRSKPDRTVYLAEVLFGLLLNIGLKSSTHNTTPPMGSFSLSAVFSFWLNQKSSVYPSICSGAGTVYVYVTAWLTTHEFHGIPIVQLGCFVGVFIGRLASQSQVSGRYFHILPCPCIGIQILCLFCPGIVHVLLKGRVCGSGWGCSCSCGCNCGCGFRRRGVWEISCVNVTRHAIAGYRW